MNKTSKVCVAATLALGTLIGVTVVENSAPTSKQAQAAITPYYTYNGYIGNNANFILDKNFINAIKYDNVKFNGIKLAKTNTIKKVEKYDRSNFTWHHQFQKSTSRNNQSYYFLNRSSYGFF